MSLENVNARDKTLAHVCMRVRTQYDSVDASSTDAANTV